MIEQGRSFCHVNTRTQAAGTFLPRPHRDSPWAHHPALRDPVERPGAAKKPFARNGLDLCPPVGCRAPGRANRWPPHTKGCLASAASTAGQSSTCTCMRRCLKPELLVRSVKIAPSPTQTGAVRMLSVGTCLELGQRRSGQIWKSSGAPPPTDCASPTMLCR